MTEEKNRDTDWDAVLKILGIIKSKITEETDLLWTNYNSAEELIAEINIIDNLLQDRNIKGVQVLGYLFAPTGTLQEIAMQNDWIQEYLNLSSKFDTLYENLK
ncbi:MULTISPECIES: hypothetical protein [Flavobacterium]|uniref:DUF4298 domain-containing protein n=1 Tax=Flavobacterium ginsengisoli TaxID=871694 RepID=A0ABP7G6H5_9FLAO|nr:hypothetical protein [Flavobacterium sp. IB48]MBJ2123822.1 hypothetical protein [Flavobacterium sp. IB48]